MCGSFLLPPEKRDKLKNDGFFFDDQGTNISTMNPWLGDLTGLYWVWKNTTDEFVGTNQYRRFFEEEHISTLEYDKNTFYVTNPFVFEDSIYNEFKKWHGELPLIILKDLADKKIIDLPFVDQLKEMNILTSCNMFFCHRELFDKLCEILFTMLFEMYNGLKYALPYIQPNNQTRMLAFLSERMLTLIFNNINYYFKDAKVQPVCMRVIL